MEKFINLKTAIILISAVLFFSLISFFRGCSTSSKLDSLEKKNKILTSKIDSSVTEKQLNKSLEMTMYKFLIFEEDIDKKRMSLSEIQLKLEGK
jgi:hypothetical protein